MGTPRNRRKIYRCITINSIKVKEKLAHFVFLSLRFLQACRNANPWKISTVKKSFVLFIERCHSYRSRTVAPCESIQRAGDIEVHLARKISAMKSFVFSFLDSYVDLSGCSNNPRRTWKTASDWNSVQSSFVRWWTVLCICFPADKKSIALSHKNSKCSFQKHLFEITDNISTKNAPPCCAPNLVDWFWPWL